MEEKIKAIEEKLDKALSDVAVNNGRLTQINISLKGHKERLDKLEAVERVNDE
jgi:hypothetical protein